jgi:alpha-tubulin suppressor-like RCC1 family protein
MKQNRKRGITCRWSRVVCGLALAVLLGTLATGGPQAGAVEDPVEVFVSAIAAGENHSMALQSDGTVWTWGWNRDGQLGDGTVVSKRTPVKVIGLTDVTAISAGTYHSVALRSDGTVWAWGQNLFGQLGDGTSGVNTYKNAPVQVTGLTSVIAIACGSQFTMALTRDHTVWVWGNNFGGVIGDWNTYRAGNSPVPVQVSGLAVVAAIAAGTDHALALVRGGSVWTWGDNGWGQLGGGTVTSNNKRWGPQQVLTGAKAIAAGGGSYQNRHSVIIKLDGTAWTFGYNSHGELGNGTTAHSKTPVPVNWVTGLTGAIAAAAGSDFTTALRSDGTVWNWGNNYNGQLGDGTTTQRLTPVQVSGLTGVTALVAAGSHTLVLKNDRTVWGWGFNGSGQLGDGTTTNRSTPVQVIGLREKQHGRP